jgi:hypothetical protein
MPARRPEYDRIMYHAQALVLTARPSAFAAHAAAELGLEFTTEWSAESGTVELPDGVCDMHAWPEGLRLDAFASTSDGLARIEDVLKTRLEHLGKGEQLNVDWYRRPSAT